MASALEDMLTEAGAEVVALAPSVAAALKAMEQHTIDIACLDINLGSETSFPLADELALRGIPFVFVTAYDATSCRRPTAIAPSSARRRSILNW